MRKSASFDAGPSLHDTFAESQSTNFNGNPRERRPSLPAGFGQSISPTRKVAGKDGRRSKATPGKITLDLSTTLGEYSGLVNEGSSVFILSHYPSPATADLTPPLKFADVTPGHLGADSI